MNTGNMTSDILIDPAASVNEVMAQHPRTIAVFNQFGVDTCCGGGAPIRDAAHRDGVDADALLQALRSALSETEAG